MSKRGSSAQKAQNEIKHRIERQERERRARAKKLAKQAAKQHKPTISLPSQ
jgi:hypothetical protein